MENRKNLREGELENLTDEKLVQIAQVGDLHAEEYLIRKYKDVVRIRAQLYFIMGADGDDVVQEGMIGLFKAIKSYKPERTASFHTFAELCINRQIITAIKTANRKKHSPLNTSISLNNPVGETIGQENATLQETLPAGSEADPEELLVIKDVMNYILSNDGGMFSNLEMKVWNEYLQGKGYLEIAGITEKTPKAIDNAIQRIKKKILAYLCQ
ncbi:MAG: RNA polymerase sporulation sigma factor SigH [Anaerovoracaceae bacterium]